MQNCQIVVIFFTELLPIYEVRVRGWPTPISSRTCDENLGWHGDHGGQNQSSESAGFFAPVTRGKFHCSPTSMGRPRRGGRCSVGRDGREAAPGWSGRLMGPEMKNRGSQERKRKRDENSISSLIRALASSFSFFARPSIRRENPEFYFGGTTARLCSARASP